MALIAVDEWRVLNRFRRSIDAGSVGGFQSPVRLGRRLGYSWLALSRPRCLPTPPFEIARLNLIGCPASIALIALTSPSQRGGCMNKKMRGTALVGQAGALLFAAAVSVSLVSCSGTSKPTAEEQRFIERVKSSRAAQPGSPMAEAYPDSLTEHLSWSWPDDKTLVSQGYEMCAISKEYPSLMPFNQSAELPFLTSLTSYTSTQASALWYAAANTLCPEQGADQYFKP
jgi:hypothetical protein